MLSTNIDQQNSNKATEQSNTRQYSQALRTTTQNYVFPSKEQGILFNVNEDLKLSDYVVAVGEVVQPKNILFASRISHNRISIYLSSSQLVEKLIREHNTLQIKGHNLNVRRLVTPAKRLILSSVCPSIPHDILENEIAKLGYVTASPVTFLKAGITEEAYSHVLSFRRQIFVLPNEEIELPSSVDMLWGYWTIPYGK